MNQTRRKALTALQDRIIALNLHDLFVEVRAIADELETLREEEEEAYENLPESLQEGERGQDMQAAIESMQEAWDQLDALADAAETNGTDDMVQHIDDAKGQ